jgi:hypothetical protein
VTTDAPSLPSDVESLQRIIADREATDHDIRARLVDLRALRIVVRQARDVRYQSLEAGAHLLGEFRRLRANLTRPGVISPTIRTYLAIPSPAGFLNAGEYFRLMLQRVSELHAAASRRLVEGRAATAPTAGSIAENPQSRLKRSRRLRELSKIQLAIAILQYRARRSNESIRVVDIAAQAGCSPQNLRRSAEFQRAYAIMRGQRIRRGWKIDGVADALDDATSDEA